MPIDVEYGDVGLMQYYLDRAKMLVKIQRGARLMTKYYVGLTIYNTIVPRCVVKVRWSRLQHNLREELGA
jgi:hypothetical protein